MGNNIGRIKIVFKLSKYISKYKLQLFFEILVHGICKLLPILIEYQTALIISTACFGDIKNVYNKSIVLMIFVILNGLFYYLDILVSHDIAYRILTDLTYYKYDEISPKAFQNFQSGEIVSVILEDVKLLEWFYAHTISQVMIAIILPIIGIIILSMFSIYLGLIILFFISLLLGLQVLSKQKSDNQGRKIREKFGELNAVLIDGIQGVKGIN